MMKFILIPVAVVAILIAAFLFFFSLTAPKYSRFKVLTTQEKANMSVDWKGILQK